MELQATYLQRLLKEAENALDRVNRSYYFFKDEQLNWKPDAKSWSIGEVYEHIINSHLLYYNYFEDKIYSAGKLPEDNIMFKHTLMGKMIIKTVSPGTKRKVKTFKIFEPTSSVVNQDVITKFKDQHEKLINFVKGAHNIELKKIKMSSPANKLIRYNLGDALGILVYHTQRHINQIDKVSKLYGK